MTGAETITVNLVSASGVSLCVTGIYRSPSLDVDASLKNLDLFMSTRKTCTRFLSFQVTSTLMF